MSSSFKLDFIIAGVQKAGTTSLHEWLKQHSDINLPKVKETHFFSNSNLYNKELKGYIGEFSEQENLIFGEACPEYIFFPEALERLKLHNPKLKIILILRSPLDRALSQYKMNLRAGMVEDSFMNQISYEQNNYSSFNFSKKTNFSYINRSLYSSQIKHLLKLFPREQLYICKFEDLTDEDSLGENTFLKITQFIGSKENPNSVDRDIKSNRASKPRFITLRDFLYKPHFLKKIIRPLLSKKVRTLIAQRLDLLNQVPNNDSISDVVSTETIDTLITDLRATQELSGLDLESWIMELQRKKLPTLKSG